MTITRNVLLLAGMACCLQYAKPADAAFDCHECEIEYEQCINEAQEIYTSCNEWCTANAPTFDDEINCLAGCTADFEDNQNACSEDRDACNANC